LTADAAAMPSTDTPPRLIAIDTNRYYSAGRITGSIVRGFVIAIPIAAAFVGWVVAIVFLLLWLGELVDLDWIPRPVAAVLWIVVMAGPIVLAVVVAQSLLERHARTQAAEVLQQSPPEDRRSAAEAIVESYVRSAYARPQVMTGGLLALVDAAWFGTVILAGPAPEGFVVEPIPAAIEPVALDRTDSAYRELAGLDVGSDKAAAPMSTRSRRRWVRVLSRSWHFTRTTGRWIGAGLLLIMVVIEGLGSLRAGTVTAGFLFWTALALTRVPFIRRGLAAGSRLPSWFLVAGGLIHRKRSWFRGDRLHLFTRSTSALFIYAGIDGQCHFGVADNDAHRLYRIGEDQMQMLLAAWFSPAQPPSREQVERLFGSEAD